MSLRVLSVLATLMVATAVHAESPSDRDFERAARSYRIQTYHAFRTNRAEYDLRIEQGSQVFEAWANAQSDAGKQALHDWFVSTTPSHDSKTNAESKLPDLPDFLDGIGETEGLELAADTQLQSTEPTSVAASAKTTVAAIPANPPWHSANNRSP